MIASAKLNAFNNKHGTLHDICVRILFECVCVCRWFGLIGNEIERYITKKLLHDYENARFWRAEYVTYQCD